MSLGFRVSSLGTPLDGRKDLRTCDPSESGSCVSLLLWRVGKPHIPTNMHSNVCAACFRTCVVGSAALRVLLCKVRGALFRTCVGVLVARRTAVL